MRPGDEPTEHPTDDAPHPTPPPPDASDPAPMHPGDEGTRPATHDASPPPPPAARPPGTSDPASVHPAHDAPRLPPPPVPDEPPRPPVPPGADAGVPPSSAIERRPARGQGGERPLAVVAAVLLLALAAAAALRSLRADESTGYVIGTALGSVGLPIVIAAVVARFTSSRTGLIVLVAVSAVALVGTASQASQEHRTAREIEAALADAGIENDPVDLNSAERECLAESGLDPDDLLTALTDTGTAGTDLQLGFLDVIAACVPEALLTDSNVEQFTAGFSAQSGGDITDQEARCVLTELVAHPSPSELLGPDGRDAYGEILLGCLSEESLAALRGDAGTGPQAIGDDPTFDRLADLCEAGQDTACDILFDRASAGSEYAVLADDCAGRGLGSDVSCLEGFTDVDGDGSFDDDSPGWTAVTGSCEAGEMLACDFIYTFSGLGTDLERVGETCGGRHAVATAESCLERYGETATD